MNDPQNILGIDIGSVSVGAAVVSPDGNILHTAYAFHLGQIGRTLKSMLRSFDLSVIGRVAATASTPPIVKAHRRYDNRVAAIAAARHFHDKIGSILIVGGEKFGVLWFDENGHYRNFKSNSGCAAGTGSFLDQQARRLNLSGVAELGRIALTSSGNLPKIASRCAVFAKTDLVHAQQEGYALAEICNGLCYGLARNIVETLFVREPPRTPIIFTGGVSQNKAVVKHIETLIGKHILADNTYCYGAAGAALSLLQESPVLTPQKRFSIKDILIAQARRHIYFHEPLKLTLSDYPDFKSIETFEYLPDGFSGLYPVEVDVYQHPPSTRPWRVYLGFDIGSTSTKAVLLDSAREVVAGFYTRTAGRPIDAVQEILCAIADWVLKQHIEISFRGVASTGSGRKLIGKILGADMIIDEITAHARAAVELNPQVDTIIEIGGQDSKFTTLKNGQVTFSIMNTVCAAGTGSFIEEQAQKLDCPLSDYSHRAEQRKAPAASDRCTVFMERDINHYLSEDYPVDSVLASVLHSIRENYLSKVAIEKNIGETILFQGATAKNKALVAAFEQRLQRPIHVSRYCHLTGALGSALLLADKGVARTRFRGLEIYRKHIPITSEICSLCTNHCKITVADLDGEAVAYGFLCGREYHTQKFISNNRSGFDLLKTRKKFLSPKKTGGRERAVTIGLPAALHLYEDLSFWQTFFSALSIQTVTSQDMDSALKTGKRLAAAEFCAPITALHGHVASLLDRCDYVFLPYYFEQKPSEKDVRRQYCYYTQFSPCLTPAMSGPQGRDRFLKPLVYYLYSSFHTKAQLYQVLKTVLNPPVRFRDVSSAYDHALRMKASRVSKLKKIYKKETGNSDAPHVVLLGRPYTVLSKTMNKGIPDIFASHGIKTFYQDMLSYTRADVETLRPLLTELHWLYAAGILEAAEVAAKTDGAYPVLITAFKCSPDSFVIEYFKMILAAHQKPYLILQLDEHGSRVGYETRIEAAIRSFANHHAAQKGAATPNYAPLHQPLPTKNLTDKILIIPNWDALSAPLIAANLESIGLAAMFLEESQTGIQRSLRHNTGQCIPLNIIAQDFIDYILTHDLDPARCVLWLAAGHLPCNLKLYPYHIKNLLQTSGKGFEKAGVFVGHITMADISVKLPLNNYFAYMFGGHLRKMGCRLRPYEKIRGATDRIIAESLEILVAAFRENRPKTDALAEVVSLFETIAVYTPKERPDRPKVAVFGDLFARDNDVINQNLLHFIEDSGGEALTTPYSCHIKMIARPYFKKWFTEGSYLTVLTSLTLFQTAKHKEAAYYKYFERILKTPQPQYDDPPEEILSQYGLRMEHTGESMENLLKIHYIKKTHPEVALFVQVSPAFCCPALVTEAMAKEIEKATGTPIISITYDGTAGNKNDAVIPYLKLLQTERTARYRMSV